MLAPLCRCFSDDDDDRLCRWDDPEEDLSSLFAAGIRPLMIPIARLGKELSDQVMVTELWYLVYILVGVIGIRVCMMDEEEN